jgi:hypothetical protein
MITGYFANYNHDKFLLFLLATLVGNLEVQKVKNFKYQTLLTWICEAFNSNEHGSKITNLCIFLG